MQFLVDAQLPPALARWLDDMGHNAKHVSEVGLQSASDRAIWDYAVTTAAAIITKDEDFAQRRALVDGPAIIWVRLPNARRQDLLGWFEKALPAILEALDRGEGLIEVI
jgi:predicted nuclease of predicted toxin-antitoxin system